MFDPWDYPPEANFSQPQARLYGLPEVWGALNDPRLAPDLIKKWVSSSRRFPRWVVEQIQTTKMSGHSGPRFYYEEWDRPTYAERPDWRELYASELAESNGLAFALADSETTVYRLAKLSGREVEVFKAMTAGSGTTDAARVLDMDQRDVDKLYRRAIVKLRDNFVRRNLYITDDGCTNVS